MCPLGPFLRKSLYQRNEGQSQDEDADDEERVRQNARRGTAMAYLQRTASNASSGAGPTHVSSGPSTDALKAFGEGSASLLAELARARKQTRDAAASRDLHTWLFKQLRALGPKASASMLNSALNSSTLPAARLCPRRRMNRTKNRATLIPTLDPESSPQPDTDEVLYQVLHQSLDELESSGAILAEASVPSSWGVRCHPSRGERAAPRFHASGCETRPDVLPA